MTSSLSSTSTASARLTSLDQFRGYTMFGMLIVNFLGGYKAVCPYILRHHHDYCSYADTIMPQFLFAAGFAMRLSLGKRFESGGKMPWGRAVRRILGLALVAIGWYSFCSFSQIVEHFRKEPASVVIYWLCKGKLFQTLSHIAATSLWILPVIVWSWKARLGFAAFSGVLHLLLSWWFNYEWVYSEPSGVDGGPLGFLTWSIPALCGTLACDAVRTSGTRAARRIAISGMAVMLFAWLMSCGTVLYNVRQSQPSSTAIEGQSPASSPTAVATRRSPLDPEKYAADPVFPTLERLRSWDGSLAEPPFVPPPDFHLRRWNYWMMSQRGGTLSYPTFGAGISLLIYAFFLWLSDVRNIRLGFFRTLGTNSLAAYLLHDIGDWIVSPFFPEKTTSVLVAISGFICFTLFVYGSCRFLEWRGWYLRV